MRPDINNMKGKVRHDNLFYILCELLQVFPEKLFKKTGSEYLLPNTFLFSIRDHSIDAFQCNISS
jgi:hypothetical protein